MGRVTSPILGGYLPTAMMQARHRGAPKRMKMPESATCYASHMWIRASAWMHNYGPWFRLFKIATYRG